MLILLVKSFPKTSLASLQYQINKQTLLRELIQLTSEMVEPCYSNEPLRQRFA